MDKKSLKKLLPANQNDERSAKQLVALGIVEVEPVIPEMLRWLRVSDSPVADVFSEFFATHGEKVASETSRVLMSSRVDHLRYIIVTRVLPMWSKPALEKVSDALKMLVTHSGSPETALMSVKLLAKYELAEPKWLGEWLNFIHERMSRNLQVADEIRKEFFSA